MKKLYILLLCMVTATVVAQTTVLTTQPTFTANNGSGLTTFNFQNSNPFPIVITEVSTVINIANTSFEATLWVNQSPVSGAPGTIATFPSNGWVAAAVNTVTSTIGSGTNTIAEPVLTNISVTIPANTTVGMAVGCFSGITGRMRYFTIPAGPNPTFTAGGVTLRTGDQIGYGFTSPTANPINLRGFVGSLSFQPALVSPNDAGITQILSPVNFCSNTVLPVTATLRNFGTTQLTSATVNWTVDGIPQPAVLFSGILDTAGGVGSRDTTLTLGFYSFGTTSANIVAWSSLPNGFADTVNNNDTAVRLVRSALSGNYTVGGAGASFPSMTALAQALSEGGVCGPVVIDVDSASGPYNGQVLLLNVQGTSPTNTIRINGNGAVVSHLTTTTDYSIIRLTGTSYTNLNGFRIRTQNTSNSVGIMLSGNANFNTIENNRIEFSTTNTTLTSVAGIAITGALNSVVTQGANGSFDTIRNNIILGGGASGGTYYGISITGSTTGGSNGHVIENNLIEDFYFHGIHLSNTNSNLISRNDISRPNRNSISTFNGIFLTGVCENNIIERNRIHNPSGGNLTSTSQVNGINFSSSSATVGNENRVFNNLIYNLNGNGTQYGIFNTGSSGMHAYFNSVSMDDVNATAGITRGFFQTTAASNILFRNNIISITRGGNGIKYALFFATTTSSIVSNNNCLFVNSAGSGTQGIGTFGTVASANLTSWQAANSGVYDQNSVSVNPLFVNAASGNLLPGSGAADNIGVSVSGITTDFDGTLRSTTTPDAGAYEFTGVSSDASLVRATFRRGLCYSASDTLEFEIRNLFGGSLDLSINPLFLNWSVTGINNSSGTISLVGGVIAVGQDTVIQVTGVNLSSPGTYLLNANINLNAFNLISGNDTIVNQSFIVEKLLIASPALTMIGNLTDTVRLNASSRLFPGSGFIISEISHFRGATTGAPSAGWPAYLLADDYLEITGVPFSDLGGFKVEHWSTTALIHTFTFPTGTLIGPNGTAIIAIGQMTSSVPSPSNYYYMTNYTGLFSSTDLTGHVLKNSADIVVDAVGYSGAATPYVFPAASGVTSADWSLGITGAGSTAGIRLQGLDVNTGANWVVSSATFPQNPNIVNTSIMLPTAGTLSGFDWLLFGVSISPSPAFTVGPFTTNGVFEYVARYNDSTCGFLFDTAVVQVMILGIETLEDAGTLKVYPNPVVDYLEIRFSDEFFSKSKSIELIDINGKVLIQNNEYVPTNIILPLHTLPTGIYVLQVIVDGKKIQRKILKQ